jgi:TP901 family phage tail tape measure protein
MATSTASTTKSIQKSFDLIKVPTLGDLGRVAGQGALSGVSDGINKIRTSFSAIGPNVAAGLNSGLASINNAYTATGEFRRELSALRKGEIQNLVTQDGPAFRYAMYDVASSLQQVSLAAGAAGVAVLTMSARYETAFTDIERTTMASDSNLQFLREQFLALSKDIPLAFSEITRIGALGAQLGVADSALVGFTETVSQFSATTNVSIESAAQAFGALGELLNIDATGFANLGSAIAFVGVNSVATETEILSVATAISGVAAQAGASKEFTIGLAGALASLRVPAEQSRGALTRVFQEINRAAAENGPQLQKFASVLGMTTDEAKALADSNIEEFFLKFTKGLSGMSAQQLTLALDTLQLADIRVTNTLARLSSNQDVVNATLEDSAYGFENGAVLAALYANRAEDLASKFQILINSLSELAARFGDAVSPTFGMFIDNLVKLATDLSVAMTTKAGKSIGEFAGIVGSAITVIFGLAAAIGVATASLAAFNFVKDKLGLSAVAASVGELTTAWLTNAAGANTAAFATNLFKVALIGTGIGAAVVLLSTLAASFMQVGTDAQSASAAFSNMISNTSGLAEAMAADRQALNEAYASGNQEVLDSFVAINSGLFANTEANEDNAAAIRNTADVLGMTVPALGVSNAALEENTAWLGDNTRAWLKNQLMQSEAFQEMVGNSDFMTYFNALGGNMDQVIDAAAKDGQQGIINYFKTLETTGVGAAAIASGRISSAFQIDDLGGRVSGIQALGALRVGPWETVSNAVGNISKSLPGFTNAMKLAGGATNESAAATDEYTGSLDGLDKSAGSAAKRIYTLIDYSNDLSAIFERAFDIRFSGSQSIDKVTSSFAKMAKATSDARNEVNELNADISKLQSDRAIQEYFLSIAEAYGDVLKAQQIRASLAKIDTDLTKKTQSLSKAQDKTNKTLVGTSDVAIENRKDILDLVKGYQDHIKALASSGMRQEELRENTQKLKADFIAQATQLGYNTEELGIYASAFDDVTAAINAIPRDITVEFNGDPALTAIEEFMAKAKASLGGGVTMPVYAEEQPESAEIAGRIEGYLALRANYLAQLEQLGSSMAAGPIRRSLSRVNGFLSQYGYAEGGYTGAGGKYDVAGIVHRGEYVVPKSEVNQSTKLPYFMEQPRMFYQGGYVGSQGSSSSSSVVALTPGTIQAIANAVQPMLFLDGQKISDASSAAYSNNTKVGAY